MDRLRVLTTPAPAPVDLALAEIDAAIALVAGGGARRVRLCGLAGLERAAASALARAQAAGLAFELQRNILEGGAVSLVIGPATAAESTGPRRGPTAE